MGETASIPLERFAAVRALAQGWWLFLLRGVLGILFGIVIFLFPGVGLAVILAFLAAWVGVDGVASLVHAFRGTPDPTGRHRSRTWLTLDGIASLALAAVVLIAPGISAIFLVICVGAWALVVGVFRLVMAWRSGSWMLGLLGAVSVLAGLMLMIAPGPGLLAVIWIVALEAIAMGVLFVGLGWRLRKVANDPHGPVAA
ncbi:hypothetical protein DFH01_06135 [Falsiroseomonas bella]|uniref:HdeD family acid-resistance protein n=1 Tax=Falsiroseomonas bella TaxID=2184016 RepID=A0A317FMI4_9PROT|nr:DUF308 domain-containing protein [Falsiroseomonas bella]PWS38826.1 hypothetical protein DFH01_06135 [Falsiroseomonas bella]